MNLSLSETTMMATTTGVIGIDVKCVIASNFTHMKYEGKDGRNLEWQSRLAINKISNYANHNDCGYNYHSSNEIK